MPLPRSAPMVALPWVIHGVMSINHSTTIDGVSYCVEIFINWRKWKPSINIFEHWSRLVDGYGCSSRFVSLLSLKDDCLDMIRKILWCCPNEWESNNICPIVCGTRGEVRLWWCRYWLVGSLCVRQKNVIHACLLCSREYPVSGGLPENVRRPEDKENYVLLLKELRQQLKTANRTQDRPYLLTVA